MLISLVALYYELISPNENGASYILSSSFYQGFLDSLSWGAGSFTPTAALMIFIELFIESLILFLDCFTSSPDPFLILDKVVLEYK